MRKMKINFSNSCVSYYFILNIEKNTSCQVVQSNESQDESSNLNSPENASNEEVRIPIYF